MCCINIGAEGIGGRKGKKISGLRNIIESNGGKAGKRLRAMVGNAQVLSRAKVSGNVLEGIGDGWAKRAEKPVHIAQELK